MAEETYRPQKKSINPSELSKFMEATSPSPAENVAKLEQIAQIRDLAAAERGGGEPVANPLRDAPFQITGNPSNPLAQKFMDTIKAADQDQPADPRPRPMARPTGPKLSNQGSTGPTQNPLLKDILTGLKRVHYREIQLPSKGKFYNGSDGPTDGILHIRPMTGHEESILATPAFTKKFSVALNRIFMECIQGSFNPEQLLVQDRDYLIIYLRGISYTPDYDVELRCPECDREFQTTIDLNSLMVDECSDDFTTNNLCGVLPVSNLSFKYRLPRNIDSAKLDEHKEMRLKFDTRGQVDDTLLFRLALLLEDIAGLTDKEEIKLVLNSLPAADLACIRTTIDEVPFGVKTMVEIECPSCHREFSMNMPMELSFFYPRGKMASQTTQ